MSIYAFGDESGIQKKGYACYGIGAFFFPAAMAERVNAEVESICAAYQVSEELKWSRINDYRATIEAGLEAIELLLGSGCGFHAMVVEKKSFHKWKTDQEEAFYTSYYYLARHLGQQFVEPVHLFIDDKSDRYAHRVEVLHTVTNRALAKLQAVATVEEVTKIDSKKHRALQVADLLIGAITADTNAFLGGTNPVNQGKKEVISRLASLFGWDGLRYDTMPNSVLNIWHFPIEFRGRVPTRSIRLSPRSLATGRQPRAVQPGQEVARFRRGVSLRPQRRPEIVSEPELQAYHPVTSAPFTSTRSHPTSPYATSARH
jgi:hypothetical protein